jgi:hypothetical protein
METIDVKILHLKGLLRKIIGDLGALDSFNFYDNIRVVQTTINEVNLFKLQLKREFDINLLRKYDPELLFLAKQIKNSFDNVSRKIKIESDQVSKELRDLQNSKKLTSYR